MKKKIQSANNPDTDTSLASTVFHELTQANWIGNTNPLVNGKPMPADNTGFYILNGPGEVNAVGSFPAILQLLMLTRRGFRRARALHIAFWTVRWICFVCIHLSLPWRLRIIQLKASCHCHRIDHSTGHLPFVFSVKPARSTTC